MCFQHGPPVPSRELRKGKERGCTLCRASGVAVPAQCSGESLSWLSLWAAGALTQPDVRRPGGEEFKEMSILAQRKWPDTPLTWLPCAMCCSRQVDTQDRVEEQDLGIYIALCLAGTQMHVSRSASSGNKSVCTHTDCSTVDFGTEIDNSCISKK